MKNTGSSHAPWQKILQDLGPVEELFKTSPKEVEKLYQKYLNSSAVFVMHFIGMNRSFLQAKGAYVYDEKGETYLDFLSGFGAVNLGHEPDAVVRALALAEGRPNLIQSAFNPAAAKLAALLAAITPGELQRSFFCNSGAEAVEAAIKLARAATGRCRLLSCQGAFHGKTMGALSVSGKEKYKNPFEPLLPETEQIPYGDLKSLEERLANHDVACFILEPIQGENGVQIPPPGYLKGAEALCKKYRTLFVLDEVQTGFGRTGRLFACEHEGVVPDILILSKSLGGGVMPIGAIITTDRLWKAAYGGLEKAFLHSSTFGGNTRACLAAYAAVRALLESDGIEKAEHFGKKLLEGLLKLKERYPILVDVRGRGLMIGISFLRLKGNQRLTQGLLTLWIARQLLKHHHILSAFTLNNLDTLRIAPPLCVEESMIEDFLKALEDVLKSAEKFRMLKMVRSE